MKTLMWNQRVNRQARALAEAGYDVTVFSIDKPEAALRHDEVSYIEVPVETLYQRFVDWAVQLRYDIRARFSRFLAGLPQPGVTKPIVKWTLIVLLLPVAVAFLLLRSIAILGIYLVIMASKPGDLTLDFTLWEMLKRGLFFSVGKLVRPYIIFLRSASFCANSRRLAAGKHFDVIQCHDTPPISICLELAAQHKAALVLDMVELVASRTNVWSRMMTNAAKRRLLNKARLACAKADHVLFVSEGHRNWYRDNFDVQRSTVLYNVCPPLTKADKSAPGLGSIRQDCKLSDGEFLLVYSGAIYQGIGIDRLVDLFSRLGKSFHLAIVGVVAKGTEFQAVLDKAASLGMADRVHYLGAQPTSLIVSYISGGNASIILFTGDSENVRTTLPNRLFDALAARLPLVVFDNTESGDFVLRHGIGEVFDPDSPGSFATQPWRRSRSRPGCKR